MITIIIETDRGREFNDNLVNNLTKNYDYKIDANWIGVITANIYVYGCTIDQALSLCEDIVENYGATKAMVCKHSFHTGEISMLQFKLRKLL